MPLEVQLTLAGGTLDIAVSESGDMGLRRALAYSAGDVQDVQALFEFVGRMLRRHLAVFEQARRDFQRVPGEGADDAA